MALIDRVRDLVAPIVDAESVELYDIEHNGGVLRIFVDDPDRVLGDTSTGIDIAVIKRISRSVSHVLDEADPIPGRYTLEVSSPGLERSLRTPDHYRKALGAKVKVKTTPQTEGDRRVTGELVSVDDDGFALQVDGEARRLAYDDVASARTVFEWGPTPKPGGSKGSKKSATNKNASAADRAATDTQKSTIPEKEAPTS